MIYFNWLSRPVCAAPHRRLNASLVGLTVLTVMGIGFFQPAVVHAQITNWQTGQVITGTESITPRPGVRLSYWNTDSHNLRYADLSGGLDLYGSEFENSWLDYARFNHAQLGGANLIDAVLTAADLSNTNLNSAALNDATLTDTNLTDADLTNASLLRTMLTNANFSGATVAEAELGRATAYGFTASQLYSTASYQNHDLHAIWLNDNNLTNWNFIGQNLTVATFSDSTLHGANLALANLDHASFFRANLTSANLTQANLTSAYLAVATLVNADLSRANLSLASLHSASLSGADFTDADVSKAILAASGLSATQLYATASYKNRDLRGIRFGIYDGSMDLTGWNLANQDLQAASFEWCIMSNADLSGATIADARFGNTTARGFTSDQLYSTASYRNRDLHGIDFFNCDLSSWSFVGQNLMDARFGGVQLATTGADLRLADTRGASYYSLLSWAITTNTILPNGHIDGLNLSGGQVLTIRDYDGGIAVTIDREMILASDSTLEVLLGDETWGSTISLAGGFAGDLGGSLKLDFASGGDPHSLVGATFDLFDWNGQLAMGEQFDQITSLPGHQWDLTDLYTTGEVTLLAVPEPASIVLLTLGMGVLMTRRRVSGPRS